MIHETFVASTPKIAYEEARKKYGEAIKLISAKQIKYDDGKIRSELTIAIASKDFYNASEIFEINIKSEQESIVETIKALFIKQGVASLWLDKIILSIEDSEAILKDEISLVTYLLEKIDARLMVVEENFSEPKIIMLVGATGVGKTTTIAKLSARYTYLLSKSYKVALLNLDSYKVGAYEQLGHYAGVMEIEHIALNSVDAYKESLRKLENYDVILVDTAGMSPYDTQKFIHTVEFLEVEVAKKVEVNLVIPATIKYEDIADIYNHFSFLDLHSLIISKFDETKSFGTLLNFMLLYDLPMSYFCVGQEVPDDLEEASKEYLLEKFIGDFEISSDTLADNFKRTQLKAIKGFK